jgi:dTDP-4-dehydrorhamnose reductase
MTRVLVWSTNAQLGREIQRAVGPPGFDVRAVTHEQLDSNDGGTVIDLEMQRRPMRVANAAAHTAFDRVEEEPAEAFAVIAAGAARLVVLPSGAAIVCCIAPRTTCSMVQRMAGTRNPTL